MQVTIPPRKNGFGNISAEELKFIQSSLLDLLLEFDEICKKHGIEYYLDGGSALGALRHGGFIPWDDDIDLLMKRSEFDKLLLVIDSELCKRGDRIFSYLGRKTEHHRPFARYVNTEKLHLIINAVAEARYKPGIFIDIFILDPVPSASLGIYTKSLERSEEWYHKRLNGVVGRMPYWQYSIYNFVEKFIGETRIFNHFNRKLAKYSDSEADYYVPRNGFNYAVYDADVFQKPKLIEFEGHLLPVPTLPEKFVRTHYSIDWFLLPPAEKRYSHHLTLTSTEFSVADFMNQFNWMDHIPTIHRVQERRHKYQILRKKPGEAIDKYIARVRADVASREFEIYIDSIQDGLDRAIKLRKNNDIISLLTPYIDTQLSTGFRKFGFAVALNNKYLNALLGALVSSGRFYDAERILNAQRTNKGIKQSIIDKITVAKTAEIAEQDDPKKYKPIIHGVPPVPDEADIVEPTNDVLAAQMRLLNELDKLCREYDLTYTLTGNTLVNAVLNNSTDGRYTSTAILMTTDNYDRLLDILSSSTSPDRAIENIDTNMLYPDNTTRYIDTDTTYYDTLNPLIKHPGIYVSIKPIVGVDSTMKLDAITMRILGILPRYLAWLGSFYGKMHRKIVKRSLSNTKTVISITELLDDAAPMLDDFHKQRQIADTAILTTKGYEDKVVNKHTYMVLKDIHTKFIGSTPWLEMVNLRDRFTKTNLVINTGTAYADVIDTLPRHATTSFMINKLWARYLTKKMEIIEQNPLSHIRYLPKVAYHFYRYKLYRKYIPIKDELATLLNVGHYTELEVALQDYTDNFVYFFQKNKIFVIDKGITDIYKKFLLHKGASPELLSYIDANIDKEDYLFKKELSK